MTLDVSCYNALLSMFQGQTGFPWIDACMIQMKQEGWIHHVARHAVSCFLTRGDLWISWEDGFKVSIMTPFSTWSTNYMKGNLDCDAKDVPVFTGHSLFNTTKRITLLFIVQHSLHRNPPNISGVKKSLVLEPGTS